MTPPIHSRFAHPGQRHTEKNGCQDRSVASEQNSFSSSGEEVDVNLVAWRQPELRSKEIRAAVLFQTKLKKRLLGRDANYSVNTWHALEAEIPAVAMDPPDTRRNSRAFVSMSIAAIDDCAVERI
jgi:hypothetical protein